MSDQRFCVDFFELSFLVEACIPPRPIGREVFWDKVINHYYHQMTPEERLHLFEWITDNPGFDRNQEDCDWFYARFNPEGQYRVETLYGDIKETRHCFKRNDRYYTAKNTWITEEYIVAVQPLTG